MFLNCGAGEDSRVLWTTRRSKQSILKEISPEYSLEGLMLKLKLQLPWPLDAKNWLLGRKVMTNLDSILKSRDITLSTKVHLVKAIVFSSSHVWMWELNCEESWAPKNWLFWTVVLEKTLVNPLDCKLIQPVHSEGNQPWEFFGRNDAKAETPVLWPPMRRVDSLEKTLMLGGIGGRRRRGRQRMR